MILFFLTAAHCTFYAQQRQIDSLKQVLLNAKHDTTRFSAFIELGYQFNKLNKDSSLYFHSQADRIANLIGDKVRSAISKIETSYSYEKFGLHELAFQNLTQAEEILTTFISGTKDKSDLIRANDQLAIVYKKIGNIFKNQNKLEEAIGSYTKALKLYTQLNNARGMVWCLGTIGTAHKNLGHNKESIDCNLRALEISTKNGHKDSEAVLLGNIGMDYLKLGDFKKSLAYHHKAIEIDSALGNEEGVIRHIYHIADVYEKKGDYTKAFEIYFSLLKRAEKSNNLNFIASIYSRIGVMCSNMEQPGTSASYFEKSVKVYREIGDNARLSAELTNLSIAVTIIADSAKKRSNKVFSDLYYNKALKYLDESEALMTKLGSDADLAYIYGSKAMIYQSKNDYKRSLEYSLLTIKLFQKINDVAGLSSAYTNIATTYLKMKNYKMAEDYYLKALQLAENNSSIKDLYYIHQDLADLYKQMSDFPSALKHYEKYIQFKDSLTAENNSKAIVKQELKYEYEKQAAADSVVHAKESEIKNVELKRQSAEIKAKKNQQYALFGGLGLVMIFAGFMYNRFKITHKQKLVIEHQKEIVEEQKQLVEEKQHEILDSIKYARRIQMAQIPSEKRVQSMLLRTKK